MFFLLFRFVQHFCIFNPTGSIANTNHLLFLLFISFILILFLSFISISISIFRYVQHPVAIKALGGEKIELPLPMYLTKKERKRIRKTTREEREREKRDKMMMGLIPAPEPKFKLSNFMKVLGDQAIAGKLVDLLFGYF